MVPFPNSVYILKKSNESAKIAAMALKCSDCCQGVVRVLGIGFFLNILNPTD